MLSANAILRPSETTRNTIVFVWRSLIRALNIFIIMPAATFAILFAFGGNWSFNGIAHEVVAPVDYVVQGSTIAVRQSYCADSANKQDATRSLACTTHATHTVSIDQASADMAKQLRALYVAFVVLTFGFYALIGGGIFPKWPEQRMLVAEAESPTARAEM